MAIGADEKWVINKLQLDNLEVPDETPKGLWVVVDGTEVLADVEVHTEFQKKS